ncbi:MAG: sulfurtransferase [Gammaproteobacteria bacterium]|nr:sulfurtransferase [Gammaproteobacteria bacterium]
MRAPGFFGLVLFSAFLLTACDNEGDTTTGFVTPPGGDPVPVVVNSPGQIAQQSADDYNANTNGLITGATLQSWIDDWSANRPTGISGRLIILQVSNGDAGAEYITPKSTSGVLTYSMDTGRLVMNRSNGVITTQSMVPDGSTIDSILADYGIDPLNDMVVCAMGTGGASHAMRMGRCWYMLRYWGVPKENLAVLNGGANSPLVLDPAYLGAEATCDENVAETDCLPRSGQVSVRNLPQDNTALQATMEDVLDVVTGEKQAFVWDARNEAQYVGESFQNGGSKQGHPLGTYQLDYTNLLLIEDGSFRFKNKSHLSRYMNGETVDGAQFVYYDSGATIPLGIGNAYQAGDTIITYCETTFRAMITGFASVAILGQPTRFYDGAMVEWNSLSHIQDLNGQFILPADSPWRTDTNDRSVYVYGESAAISPRIIDDPYAAHADAIILADKAYKRGTSSGGGDGGGGGGGSGLPANPCGG